MEFVTHTSIRLGNEPMFQVHRIIITVSYMRAYPSITITSVQHNMSCIHSQGWVSTTQTGDDLYLYCTGGPVVFGDPMLNFWIF